MSWSSQCNKSVQAAK